ncbi:hypothetical protein L596_016330 [Steinernema carpocapsae]|uniref:Uncharacterized protein n=1 Tax=Steinernema carpocapsae TaxID=34508 RepID=A0A4U5NHP0_STECR|nr:hypothetical protein L596_016330 [Steinernema carpocapsae]
MDDSQKSESAKFRGFSSKTRRGHTQFLDFPSSRLVPESFAAASSTVFLRPFASVEYRAAFEFTGINEQPCSTFKHETTLRPRPQLHWDSSLHWGKNNKGQRQRGPRHSLTEGDGDESEVWKMDEEGLHRLKVHGTFLKLESKQFLIRLLAAGLYLAAWSKNQTVSV